VKAVILHKINFVQQNAANTKTNNRHEHPNMLGASVPPYGVTVLLNPSLPSCRWLLVGLYYPLHHTLHPNRCLTEVLLFFHLLRPPKLLGFVLGVATVIGRYKSLLRPLMLGCLVSWSMRQRSLISWCLMVWGLITWSLELGRRSSAMISLSGHFFLGLGFLTF
jgi:hypothetical protein